MFLLIRNDLKWSKMMIKHCFRLFPIISEKSKKSSFLAFLTQKGHFCILAIFQSDFQFFNFFLEYLLEFCIRNILREKPPPNTKYSIFYRENKIWTPYFYKGKIEKNRIFPYKKMTIFFIEFFFVLKCFKIV